MKKISIVVSVYNEEEVINKFYTELKKQANDFIWDYEVIFVNDGSEDRSRVILQELVTDKKVKVINFSRNFGHEAAMIAGIDNASGDGIVCMDADLQHPLEYILPIIQKFEDGYEVINMVRLSNKSAGAIKNITSKAFYKVINKLSNKAKFQENASDFFAISARVAEVLKNNYREKCRFLRGYVQSVGFKSTTIEYNAAERAGGKSHYNIKTLLKFSVNTIVSFSDFPLKLGGYAGGISAIVGVLILLYTILVKHMSPSGYMTIIILVLFLFAVLFWIIGVIGQYLTVLFAEIKDRPIYIIDQKINF